MRRYVHLACILSALALTTPTRADDAAVAEAQARLNEGLKLADDAKFDEARLKFLQAYAVLKAPFVLFNLASTEQRTSHEVDAVEHYRAFLENSGNDTRITDAMRDRAKKNIAELLQEVAQIDVDAPDGARITVDGKPLEDSPKAPAVVAAGKHKVEASYNGRIKSVAVETTVGQITKAKIDFDGNASNSATIVSAPDDYRGKFKPNEGTRTTAGWVVPITLGVLGASSLVMGGAFGAASQSSKDDSEKMATPGLCASATSKACSDYDAKRSDAESRATLSYVGYAAGAFFVVGAILTYLYWPKSGKTASTGRGILITPEIGRQAGAGSLQLRF